MSGIELAGLVLGAFPIALAALGKYRDVAETLGTFWRIRREHQQWTHSLNICKLAFEQNLEELLLPLIVDDDELQWLVQNPDAPKWRDPELEDRLRERLPKSYGLYLETMSRIQHVMVEVTQELGVGKSEPWIQAGKDDGILVKASLISRRIKMSLNQAKREKLFKQFTDCNNELRMLLDTSDRIASLRQKRRGVKSLSTAEAKGLWQCWRHADKLYDLLTQSWRCECRRFHLANLLLKHQPTAAAEFTILFVYSSQRIIGGPKPSPWTYQETCIRTLPDQQPAPKKTKVAFAETVVHVPEVQIIPPGTPKVASKMATKRSVLKNSLLRILKPKSKVDLRGQMVSPRTTAAPPIPPQITQVIVTDNSNALTRKPTPQGRPADVINLCDTIRSFCDPGRPPSPANCLAGNDGRFAIEPVVKSRGIPSTSADTTISLDNLLRGSGGGRSLLTRRQRYQIALTLALSYLQLHSSQWLGRQWSKRDIFFLRDASHPNGILLDQPYISRDFQMRSRRGRDTNDGTITSDGNDRTLANLGIMLLELCFGTALEDHETRRKYPSGDVAPNPFLDMAAALEWSLRAVEEAGPEFADAITWCLKNMPGSGESDSMVERWREELYQKVVEPLKYCHDQFASGPPS